MRGARAFTLFELMVVVAVISIGGSLAVFAMSDQVQIARARSDELGLFMRIKTERNAARERLRPLGISAEGRELRFHAAKVTRTLGAATCTIGEITRRATFHDASLVREIEPPPPVAAPSEGDPFVPVIVSAPRPLCIDENGRPVGVFLATISASDGRQSSVRLTETGVLETSLNVGSKDVVTGESVLGLAVNTN